MGRGPRRYNENLNVRCTEAEHDRVEAAVVAYIGRNRRVVTLSSWVRAAVFHAVERELRGDPIDELDGVVGDRVPPDSALEATAPRSETDAARSPTSSPAPKRPSARRGR